jgi:hypothetical protein
MNPSEKSFSLTLKPKTIQKRQLINLLTISLSKKDEEERVEIRNLLREIKATDGLPSDILTRIEKYI